MANVTVVTVPGPGAPRDELWRRFAAAVNVPPVDIAFPEAASNVSLGPAEAELLRHVNAVLPENFPWPRYSRAVKRHFAERRLAVREPAGKITVPPQWHDAVLDRADAMTDYLRRSGCRVVGDLADLRPRLPVAEVYGPDDLTRDQLMQVAAEVIRDEVILRPGRRRRVDVPIGEAGGWLERAWATVSQVRRRVRRGA